MLLSHPQALTDTTCCEEAAPPKAFPSCAARIRAGASLMISVVDEWELETTTTAVCR